MSFNKSHDLPKVSTAPPSLYEETSLIAIYHENAPLARHTVIPIASSDLTIADGHYCSATRFSFPSTSLVPGTQFKVTWFSVISILVRESFHQDGSLVCLQLIYIA